MTVLSSPSPLHSPELSDNDASDVFPLWVLGALPHPESGDRTLTRSLSEERLQLTLLASPSARLPAGRSARLLLAHLWTEAVRGGKPEILLAHSWRHLCALLGIIDTGGVNDTGHQVRKHLRRLVDLSFEVRRLPSGPGAPALFKSFPLAAASDLPVDGKRFGQGLTVRLSPEFFARLARQRATPFDLRFLHHLQSPLMIDLYCWCTWLARRTSKDGTSVLISWKDLQERLGTRILSLPAFRFQAVQYLKTLLERCPGFHAKPFPGALLVSSHGSGRSARKGTGATLDQRSAPPGREKSRPPTSGARQRKDGAVEATTSHPYPVDRLSAFLRPEAPVRKWLAEDLIAERGLAMVHGSRGVGKSHFVLGLSCAIASGKPVLGYEVPDPAGVLFVNAELPARELQERFRRHIKAGLRPEVPLRLLSTDLAKRGLPSLATPEGQAVIEERLDPSTKLLVLDAVNTLCPTGGGSAGDTALSDFQAWILTLCRRGLAVLLVHHDDPGGKPGAAVPCMEVLDQVFYLKSSRASQAAHWTRFEVHLGRGRQVQEDLSEPYEASVSELVGRAVWTRRPLWATEPSTAPSTCKEESF